MSEDRPARLRDARARLRARQAVRRAEEPKLYIWSYRNEGAFHEAVTNRILDDLVAATRPRFMRLTARSTCAAASSRPSSPSTPGRGWKTPRCPTRAHRRSRSVRCSAKSLYNFASYTRASRRESRASTASQSYPFQKLTALLEGAQPAPRPAADPALHRRAPAPDAGVHQARAHREPRGLAQLSADARRRDALRAGDRRVARAALRPDRRRPRQPR